MDFLSRRHFKAVAYTMDLRLYRILWFFIQETNFSVSV